MEIILDFSLENTERMIEFEKYCKENNENTCFELINRLNGIYQFSGIKILQDFLYNISFNINIIAILKFKASQGLLLFDEFEEIVNKNEVRYLAIRLNKFYPINSNFPSDLPSYQNKYFQE